MRNFSTSGGIVLWLLCAAALANERVDQVFSRMDSDRDGRISRAEWMGPPPRFNILDSDRDGFITREELSKALALPDSGPAGSAVSSYPAQTPPSAGVDNRIEESSLRNRHKPAFIHVKVGNDVLNAAGMDVTGLVPVFQKEDRCYGIDHVFGELWQGPVVTLHSGADIPAPMSEPVLSIADGVLIHKTVSDDGARLMRGYSVTLQHAPQDTGLPVWTYSTYTHFQKLPDMAIGTRFRMGEPIGLNGRSGLTGSRAAHLHLTINIGPSAKYAIVKDTVIPEMAVYIDPVALFRKKLPMETAALKTLSADERQVPISYLGKSGAPFPADTKLVWPFRCS